MKKFFTILMMICVSFAGFFVGCQGGRYDDLTISIRTEQPRAEDGSITLYVGEDSEDITVTMEGAPKNFNYVPSFSLSENIVKIGDVNHMLDNGVRKTIEGIAPGFTVLTAYTSEGSKTATLKINVIKKAESISYNTDYKLAVLNIRDYRLTIDTEAALTILPKDSNQTSIKYSIDTPGLSDVVNVIGNEIVTQPGIETTVITNFKIKAEVVNHYGEVNTNVEPTYIDVRIMDDILQEEIKLYQSKLDYEAVTPTVLSQPINETIVLSKNYQENNSIYVFVGVKTTEDITVIPPANTNSSPVMISLASTLKKDGVKYFVYRVQAIRYSDVKTLTFTITVNGYEEFYSFKTSFNVKCELYIRNFSVNDVTNIDGVEHYVSLYTNEETSGTSVKIAVGNPKEILAADARFFVAVYDKYDQLVEDYSKLFTIKNTSNNAEGLAEDGYLKNVTLLIKINSNKLGTEDSGKYKLVVTAEEPKAFAYKATTEIYLNIVQGIESIDSISYGDVVESEKDPIKINFEDGVEPLEITLNAIPAAATSYETLYAESSNDSIFTVTKKSANENIFVITPISVGVAKVSFYSKNLTSPRVYEVDVYEDIEDFFISVKDNATNSPIGKSEYSAKSLASVTVKAKNVGEWSSDIEMQLNTMPTNAKFYETNIEVYKLGDDPNSDADDELLAEKMAGVIGDDCFEFDTKKMTFSMKHIEVNKKYKVKVIMVNFDGSKISKEFIVNSYVPITELTIKLSNNTLYNPNNLGYFDLNHPSINYTKTQATVSANLNATYATEGNIQYEVIADGKVTKNLLVQTGTWFELNPDYKISKYPQKVYILVYAIELGKRVESAPVTITIKDPVTVQSMAVEGDLNGDILYFKLGHDSSKDIKVSLDPNINLFNSNVVWVQYAEGTTTILDYADNSTGRMNPIDTTDAIFAVEALGNNNFRIKSLKAGNAKLLLIPEDKIKNVNGSHYVYEWDKIIEIFVSVADGSRQYPYHVASYKDFRDIEKAMDKFYVLTNNIACEDNWIPIGYETKTPFNGGINGLYSRIINAETGEKYSVQYSVTNVSYAVALPSNLTHYGIIYSLGDGEESDEDKAILENLIVSYNYIQAEFKSELIFGGLAAINKGTIENCRVSLSNIEMQLSGLSYSVGGMVGLNDGGTITNINVDNAVTINIKVNLLADNFAYAYFGGIVGHMMSGSINGYQKDYSELNTVGITFGDQGYDVVSKIEIATEKTYPIDINTAVGGVVGYIENTDKTLAFVKDVAVSGSIKATCVDNVGGILGYVNGVLMEDTADILVDIFNATNNAKIFGRNNVGGVVGKALNTNFDYCSAENYRETQTTVRPFITGVDYVGGFGGVVEGSNISNSYVVSYFENPEGFTADDLTDKNSDIVVNSESSSAESCVGGFVAELILSDVNEVNKIAAILNAYVSSDNKINCGGLFGQYNATGSINNAICRGFAKDFGAVTGQGIVSIQEPSTYYSTLNETIVVNNIADVTVRGSGEYNDATVWKVTDSINDGLPYLLDDKGNILFAFLPIIINVEIKEQNGMDIDDFNNSGYVYVEDDAAIIYLNEFYGDELTAAQLLALNTHKITDFADLEITPLTLKTSRLVITSSNSTIVRVSQDSLIALKEGSVRITVSSKLNADYKFEFYIIVKYGLTDYKLYETSNFDDFSEVKDDETKPITMVVDKKVALYENTTYTRNVDGKDYNLKVTNTTAVKFVLENETFKDSFIINTNWKEDATEIYTEVAVSTLTTIYSKLITEGVSVKVTATPFIEISYLSHEAQIFYEHLARSFYVKVVNGADNIYFESSISPTQGIEITQLQSFVFTVIMDTDTQDDNIIATITDSEGNIIDPNLYEGSFIRLQINSGGEANIEQEIDGKKVLIGKKVSYTVSYDAEPDINGKIESLKEDKKYIIYFNSSLVVDVKVALPITVKPQDIVSADIGVYSKKSDYNKNTTGITKDGTDKFIFNGAENTALLTVEIYPDFSKFESFDVTYTSSTGFPITMTQLKYNKDATAEDNLFDDYGIGRGTYIPGYGIKVNKATGGEPLLGSGSGLYSYSKIYYFSMIVGSEVPDLTTYTITLIFYDENKSIIEPRNITYTFQSVASPQIDLSIKDTTLNGNLPLGTSNEINVETKNFEGEIAWEVSIDSNGETANGGVCACGDAIDKQYTTCIECINKNYALLDALIPTKDENGKYYLNIPKDNFDLLGRKVYIKAIIEKSEGVESFSATAELTVNITLFTVIDMSIDGLSADLLKLQIYTPYTLKVNLSAVYNQDVDFAGYSNHNGYSSKGYTIANMVSKLRDEISKAAIWYVSEFINGEPTNTLLEKNKNVLYNACFTCIGYAGYYAIYGEIVDVVSSITASANIDFVGGIPTYNAAGSGNTFAKQFNVTFTYQNDIKNSIPITNAEEFLKMEEGKDYRLTSDIMLTNYIPLSTRILSLDGNGHTIYIQSFASKLSSSNVGLFDTVAGADGVAEATMIYNLKVHYISNATENIETTAEGENKYSYTLPVPPDVFPLATVVDVSGSAAFNFGGIAAVNNGIITNCSVTGMVNIISSDEELTETYVGGLAGVNNGYITASNVYNLELTSAGNIGGVAGSNTNTISSTYTDELYINNISKNTEIFYTGGFVCNNEENAKILECYTQGRRNINDTTIVYSDEGIRTSGTAGGFVYKNIGSIEDSYSNIAINASAFSAGFVFVNKDKGLVNNCYSISKVAYHSKAASPFTGIGKDGGVVVTYEGTISNCFYLKGNYNDFGNEPAMKISLSDFASSEVFGSFNIKLNTTDPYIAEGYSWYIAEGKPRLTQTDIKTYSAYDYIGKTKNYTANSEIYFKYSAEAGKWYAYVSKAGYDTSKEIVITQRATLIYYVSSEEYYFKPALDSDKNQIYGTINGESVKLYDVIDSTYRDKLYVLDESSNRMVRYNTTTNTLMEGEFINIFYTYIENVYTEETGVASNVWKDVENGKSYYKRTAGNGKDEYFTQESNTQYSDEPTRYVYEMKTVSVTYKTSNGTSLIDLSVDSEGQCDLTYIPTAAEYAEQMGTSLIPEVNKVYGGCYSYRSLDSIQYHYGYAYLDENGNRIPEGQETQYQNRKIHELGTKNNPYLIYDIVSYNTYFKNKFNAASISDINKREYYRVVADIDFDFENISTSSKVLFGYIEGNGMTFKNITLTYIAGEKDTVSFGLFSQSLFSIVNNLNLEVIEIVSSAHTYVGGLVGWARTDIKEINNEATFDGSLISGYEEIPAHLKKNYFNNIVVYKKADTNLENVGLVLGRNFAGGLIGYMTGYSKANNIDTSVNVNATYVLAPDIKGKYLAYQNVESTAEINALKDPNVFGNLKKTDANGNDVPYTAEDWTYYINRQVSYAGLAFGVIDTELHKDDDKYNEEFSVYDIVVSGEFSGAGGTIGGVIGLLANDSIANNISVKVIKEQTIRGFLYSGGLVGENRGKLIYSSIDYQDEKENNSVTLVTKTRANTTFFNNNASTRVIGGLVGFNNGGSIETCISHIDVRNASATIAGGAVGRSINGKYNYVIVSGSVRAKTVMGGFTGTSNTTLVYTSAKGIGMAAQEAIYPDDKSTLPGNMSTTVNGTTTYIIDSDVVTDVYTSCIAANNWQIDDFAFLTEKEGVKRVAGGFIGTESLSPYYYEQMKNDEENPISSIMKIYSRMSGCFYTNSLYYGSAGKDTTPGTYMPIAYISEFDTVTLFAINVVGSVIKYMYPFMATNKLATSSLYTTNSIIGLNHYQIAYGDAKVYNTSSIESYNKVSNSVTIKVRLPYDSTIESSNFYQTTMQRQYWYKTLEVDNGENGEKTYYYVYAMNESNINTNKGFTYSEKLKPDQTVESREFGVIEKYFVYSDFVDGSHGFTIGNNFYGKMGEDVSVYPKIYIKNSSLNWINNAGTAFSMEDGYYLIESEEDLATLANVVNNNVKDDTNGGYYRDSNHKYKLMTDLDLSGKYWTPIGTYRSNRLEAVFDGNGHTIANANIGSVRLDYAGLFGCIERSTISNLTVTGGSIVGSTYSGGLVGFATYSKIINCINENSVTGSQYVGGIAGAAYYSTATNCYNKGKVVLEAKEGLNIGALYAGGIIGRAYDTDLKYEDITNNSINIGEVVVIDEVTSYTSTSRIRATLFAGGIAGYLNRPIVASDYIYNKGDITVTSNAHEMDVGGVVGNYYNPNVTVEGYYISKLRNAGNVTVYDNNVYEVKENSFISVGRDVLATAAVGGIIGKYTANQDVKIGLFANAGKVTFDNQRSSRKIAGIGGIIGVVYASYNLSNFAIAESYNMAAIDVKVNAGENNIAVGVGGILGLHDLKTETTDNRSNKINVVDCYNMGDISSSGRGIVLSGGIYGVTAVREIDEGNEYAVANDLLSNNQSFTDSHVSIANCYNIGSVTGDASNKYGLGALLGYGIGATCTSKNYYLAGSANYPAASMQKTTGNNSQGEQITIVTIDYLGTVAGKMEQRTTNTLKLIYDSNGNQNLGVDFDDYDSSWEQKVDTWYPTLKSNYETILWSDSTKPLSVVGSTYTIENGEQLAYLSYVVNNGLLDTTDVQIKLSTNIEMANKYFTPIGTKNYPFKGTFNGNGYSINNLTIDANSAMDIMDNGIAETVGSLFGYVSGGTIKNLGLISPMVINVDYAAGFAYSLENTSHMEYCYLDNYEIADPALSTLNAEQRVKLGKISGRKDTSGFAHTLINSTINAGYVSVPLVTNPVEEVFIPGYEIFKPKLAGFAITTRESVISNCYISKGVSDGCTSVIFIYNTYSVENPVFDRFVIESFDELNQVVDSVKHCYNKGVGEWNYIKVTVNAETGETIRDINKKTLENITTSSVGSQDLKNAGWDVIDIWSYEYSLLGDMSLSLNLAATIRGLGQNWYNTEANDIILKNNEGKLITQKDGNETGEAKKYIYYEIRTAEDLAWVARMVNNGKIESQDASNEKYVFKLMNDINLLGKYWTPIGTMEYPFSSKFDFNGYTISNLVIDCDNLSFGGLFGYTYNAEIYGGFMDNVYINIDATGEEYNSLSGVKGLFVGSLIGKGNNTSVADIQVKGNVVGYSKYNAYVGGLIGNLTCARGTGSTTNAYAVKDVKVLRNNDSEILIPDDYRKYNGFGIDEMITEQSMANKLKVNVAGFSITGNSYAGGILGYISGKYTQNYSTEARVEKVFNEAVVVSYTRAEISRSYLGGIVGFMTENAHLSIAQNNGAIKSATYGYDYIGGVVGMVAGASEVSNIINKAYIECSQIASILSYSGGIIGYIKDGSVADKGVNYGSSYKNTDSTKILSAGAIGYVERDVTGALPNVTNFVYVNNNNSYDNPDATGSQNATIGYYGDGELVAEGVITVQVINTLQDDSLKIETAEGTMQNLFEMTTKDGDPVWDIVTANLYYASKHNVGFSDSVIVYCETEPGSDVYTAITSGAGFAMGTKFVVQAKVSGADYILINGIRYDLTHSVSGSGTITVSPSDSPNCIVIRQLSGGISSIQAVDAA